MSDYKDKLDKATRSTLDAHLPRYTIIKKRDHYLLEYKGQQFGIIGGNSNNGERKYMHAKVRRMIKVALGEKL